MFWRAAARLLLAFFGTPFGRRGSAPSCMFDERSGKLGARRQRAGQAVPLQVDRGRGIARSPRPSRAEPEQLPGPPSEPASARTGRTRHTRRTGVDMAAEAEAHWVGIDVSKARLDVAVLPSEQAWQVTNEVQGHAALIERLRQLNPERVVLEASGGFEVGVVAALACAELPVVVINPRQVRDFAKATGQLAKTDRLDARVLAHFGQVLKPELLPLPDATTQVLSGLLTRRRQVQDMLTAERNRLVTAAVQNAPQALRDQLAE